MTVIGTSASFGSDESKVDLDVMAELRQVRGRLSPDSWHIDAVLPPDASEMVYEDLQPVAAAMQGEKIMCIISSMPPRVWTLQTCMSYVRSVSTNLTVLECICVQHRVLLSWMYALFCYFVS